MSPSYSCILGSMLKVLKYNLGEIRFKIKGEAFKPERKVHISRLNPFGYAKLTTFVFMCKDYGCEPSVDLFRVHSTVCRAGKWLNFCQKSEKHVPNSPIRLTHIEGWHERFFYVQDSIIPAKYSQLLSEQNKLDLKSFKDKLPLNIEENPMFQRLGRYPTSVHVFPDPILFLKWLSGNLSTPKMMRIYCFCPRNLRRLRHWFPICFSKHEAFKSRRRAYDPPACRPPVKRKLAPGSSTSRATCAKTFSSKEDVPYLTMSDDDKGLPDVLELIDTTICHLKTSAITPLAWKNHLDNHMDMELLDLHDRCYARQFVVDKAVNRRSRDLLQVIEKLRGEFDVIKDKEKAREEECEELRAKYEAAMTEFEKNPTVVALWEKNI
ncbi:hypothetical protein Tco_0471740 [Tanacetum coccineum]